MATKVENSKLFNNSNLNFEYYDFSAKEYFFANGVMNVTFTPRTVEVEGKAVAVIRMRGMAPDGRILIADIWARNHAADKKEITNFMKGVDNFTFRVGFYQEADEKGNLTTVQGSPKWLTYTRGGKEEQFTGGKREYNKDQKDESI